MSFTLLKQSKFSTFYKNCTISISVLVDLCKIHCFSSCRMDITEHSILNPAPLQTYHAFLQPGFPQKFLIKAKSVIAISQSFHNQRSLFKHKHSIKTILHHGTRKSVFSPCRVSTAVCSLQLPNSCGWRE